MKRVSYVLKILVFLLLFFLSSFTLTSCEEIKEAIRGKSPTNTGEETDTSYSDYLKKMGELKENNKAFEVKYRSKEIMFYNDLKLYIYSDDFISYLYNGNYNLILNDTLSLIENNKTVNDYLSSLSSYTIEMSLSLLKNANVTIDFKDKGFVINTRYDAFKIEKIDRDTITYKNIDTNDLLSIKGSNASYNEKYNLKENDVSDNVTGLSDSIALYNYKKEKDGSINWSNFNLIGNNTLSFALKVISGNDEFKISFSKDLKCKSESKSLYSKSGGKSIVSITSAGINKLVKTVNSTDSEVEFEYDYKSIIDSNYQYEETKRMFDKNHTETEFIVNSDIYIVDKLAITFGIDDKDKIVIYNISKCVNNPANIKFYDEYPIYNALYSYEGYSFGNYLKKSENVKQINFYGENKVSEINFYLNFPANESFVKNKNTSIIYTKANESNE